MKKKHSKKAYIVIVFCLTLLSAAVIIGIVACTDHEKTPEDLSSETSRAVVIRDIDTSSEAKADSSQSNANLQADLSKGDQNDKDNAEKMLVSET